MRNSGEHEAKLPRPLGPGSLAVPPDTAKWRHVERRLQSLLASYGFAEARPALIDPDRPTPLGVRSDAILSLARLWARAGEAPPGRWWTQGEMYDPRPPTTLRFPSFHAIAAATFGLATPDADAELLCLAGSLASDTLLAEPELLVGSVGDRDELRAYRGVIVGAVRTQERCPTCAASDPLRVLACDEDVCRRLAGTLPPMRMHLGRDTLRYHDQVLARLSELSIKFLDDATLAMAGATRTVFKLTARTSDGTRRTILTGARRDDVVAQLGGVDTPVVGMCLGVERAVEALGEPAAAFTPACEVFIASQGEEARRWAFKAAQAERARGFRVEVELRDVPWNAQLERARDLKARVVVLAGQPGREPGEITLRDAVRDEARVIYTVQLGSELKRLLR